MNLPLPGELFGMSADGKRIVVAHNSYISIIEDGNHPRRVETYPVKVIKASSIMLVEELVCLLPAFDQWTYIECLNMDNYGTTCTCANQVYAGGLGFVDTANNWVYVVDQGLLLNQCTSTMYLSSLMASVNVSLCS